jgi:hypothetical protein
VIYEPQEPWWNENGREKLLIHPPEVSDNPTSSHLIAKQDEMGEGNDEIGLTKYICPYFEVIFNMPLNYDMGPTALLPLRKKECCRLYRPRPGLNPQGLGPVTSTLAITPPRTTSCMILV